MLKKILIGLVLVLVVLCAVIAMQPDSYSVTRSATIGAAPEAVFGLVNDFHRWDAWSPWSKLDPNMKVTFDGPDSGRGAIYSWVGNSAAGEGRMTILESVPAEKVRIKLDFIKPFPSTADTVFELTPDGSGTKVEWTMSGDHNFLSKGMCLFTGGMDGMIGPDFERGLAQMKSVAQSGK